MRFIYPWLVYAAPVLTGLLWLALAWGERRRARLQAQFVGSGNRPWADPGFLPGRKAWELGFTLAAFALLLVTLSGPRRYRPAEKAEMQGLPYLVAIDASRSMLVNDVRPTRWAAATNALDHYLDTLVGDRVGLISFAGVAYLNAPLTFDTLAVRATLRYLSYDVFMDEQGSALGNAVERAGRYFESNNIPQKILILISDGEDFEGNMMPVVNQWARKGLRVVTVGVGTTTGGKVPLPSLAGGGDARNSSGQTVISRLNETNLKRIANSSKGRYYRLEPGNNALEKIRAEFLKPMAEQLARENTQNYQPWFQLPLALALMSLVLRLLLAADRFRRPRLESPIFPAPLPSIIRSVSRPL